MTEKMNEEAPKWSTQHVPSLSKLRLALTMGPRTNNVESMGKIDALFLECVGNQRIAALRFENLQSEHLGPQMPKIYDFGTHAGNHERGRKAPRHCGLALARKKPYYVAHSKGSLVSPVSETGQKIKPSRVGGLFCQLFMLPCWFGHLSKH